MATVESNPIEIPVAVERLLTAADLDAFPEQLPSGQVAYELRNGRLFIMNPPAADHSRIQYLVGREIGRQGEDRGHGKTFVELGLILRRDPDHVLGPDVAFLQTSRLPGARSPEGFLETIPDFVAEIRSKNDSWPEMELKAHDYLNAGVTVVWIVNPPKNSVVVYRRDSEPVAFTLGQHLTLEGVIPDFDVLVDRLFDV